MFKFLKKIFCKHNYETIAKRELLYENEINGTKQVHCDKCGKNKEVIYKSKKL